MEEIVICAGCVVVKHIDNKLNVLLIQPNKNRSIFGLPKGHYEKGETIREAAIRETIEETGILPRLISKLAPVNITYDSSKKGKITKIIHFYLAVPTDSDISPTADGKEIFDTRFYPIDNLPAINQYQIPCIEEAIEIVNSGIIEKFLK